MLKKHEPSQGAQHSPRLQTDSKRSNKSEGKEDFASLAGTLACAIYLSKPYIGVFLVQTMYGPVQSFKTADKCLIRSG